MANTTSSFSLVDLDFNNNKENLKAFLRSQPQFKDYDFDGSNLNVLIELLAYNTYKMGFYYNMMVSEAFLDSAQTRNSIVSHAKELNYTPRSRNSSKAKISVSFEATGTSAPYTIPKGSPFTALVKNQSYTFTTPEAITVSSSNTTFSFETYIYEGIFLQDVYVVSDTSEFPRYKISNKNVDTRSISVVVYEDGSEVGDIYTQKDTLLDLDSNSKIFFLQAYGDGYYEILFGDNFLGKKPKIGSTITIDYRIASGPDANGSKQFSVDFDPTGTDEVTKTPTLTVLETASDGLNEQDSDSIKIYAPRYFASQQRAVASDDYSSLILGKFAGTISDIVVYGGETIEPRRYGVVIIAIKPNEGRIAPDFIKDEIKTFMLRYVSLPTRIELVDPEYFYLQITTTVQYDINVTNKTVNEIKGIVSNAIVDYSASALEKFDADFRFSKFVKEIDNSDVSIVSNDTSVRMIKKLIPTVNYYYSVDIDFNNELQDGRYTNVPVISSSSFNYINENGVEYPFSYLRSTVNGLLEIYTTVNKLEVILNRNIGTVDYTTGIVKINKLLVSSYGSSLMIYATALKKDVIVNKQNILFIESTDLNISVIGQLQ